MTPRITPERAAELQALARFPRVEPATYRTAVPDLIADLADARAEIERLREYLRTCLASRREMEALAVDVVGQRDAAVAKVERVEAAVANHPEPCSHSFYCGWKSAFTDVRAALAGDGS